MARHIANCKIEEKGRDYGKWYVITEMSSAEGEWWATRILMALLGANVDVPEKFEDMSVAVLAELGMKALGALKPETAKPLLDEMFQNIQIIIDPKKPNVSRDLMVDTDIEEIATRLRLRTEVWKLNMGFLDAVMPSLGIAAKHPEKGPKATKTFPE